MFMAPDVNFIDTVSHVLSVRIPFFIQIICIGTYKRCHKSRLQQCARAHTDALFIVATLHMFKNHDKYVLRRFIILLKNT